MINPEIKQRIISVIKAYTKGGLMGKTKDTPRQKDNLRGKGGIMGLKEDINGYIRAYEIMVRIGEKICRTLENELKKVIPDIKVQLGWEEAGADVICFISGSRAVSLKRVNTINLSRVIREVFPELEDHIDTPYGVYVTPEEAKKIKEILENLR